MPYVEKNSDGSFKMLHKLGHQVFIRQQKPRKRSRLKASWDEGTSRHISACAALILTHFLFVCVFFFFLHSASGKYSNFTEIHISRALKSQKRHSAKEETPQNVAVD